jgi:hypothetical protein
MLRSGGLQRREVPASPLLTEMRGHVIDLWKHWDDAEAKQISAMNFLIDAPASQRRAEIQKLKEEVGECANAGPVIAENWLRGQFNLTCTHGTVGAFFTLSPTHPPAIQHLSFQKLESPSTRLGAPTGAPAGVACSE